MIGNPMWKRKEAVSFVLDGKTFVGAVDIVDEYGIFEDSSRVYCDIMFDYYGQTMQIKHIPEDHLTSIPKELVPKHVWEAL